MGACPATLVQPRPYSSPGAPALLPARRRPVAGRSAAKASGTTRSILDGCNVVDGTTTPIVMSPSSRRYLGGVRTRGDVVARVTRGAAPARAAKGVPARGRRRPRVSARSVTSSSCAWRAPSPYRVVVVEPGHQFQLRTAVPLGRRGFLEVSVVTSSSCALPFLPGRRGFSDVAAVTVTAVLPFAFARGFARRSPGPVAHRVPSCGYRREMGRKGYTPHRRCG
jgi:hypothetical protein